MRACLAPRSRVALCALLLLRAAHCGAAQTPDPAATFDEGNRLYEAGRFAEAAARYEACLAAGARGADVYYNLGNAYGAHRQIGRALAAYRAGLRIAPRDPDMRYNAQQVGLMRAEVAPRVPRSWLATVVGEAAATYTLNELVSCALLLLVTCAGLASAALMRLWRPRRLLAALVLTGVVLMATAGLCAARYSRDCIHRTSFVCVASATMRAGPGEHFEDMGVLGDGAEVQALGETGDWTEVLLATGKRAWVRSSELTRM